MKTKALCLLAVFFLLCSSCVWAIEEKMITITENPITVTYNGDAVFFPDATPTIANGRTLVPARAIMERAHLTVEFDADNRIVVATKDDLTIKMPLDNTKAEVIDGSKVKTIVLDEPARLIQNRTFVPVRFIAECLNVKVNWNPYIREVVLIDTNEWKEKIAERSRFLSLLLHKSFIPAVAEAGNSATNITLTYASENLPDADGIPRNWSADLSFSSTETNVFDGKKGGSFSFIQANLSQLMNIDADFLNIMFARPDSFTLSKLAKSHHLEIDMIYDVTRNTHIKSAGIANIFKDLEQTSVAEQMAGGYVLFKPQELYSLLFQTLDASDTSEILSTATSEWDILEQLIYRDDMLYTRSVQTINELLNTYTDLFDNANFTLSRYWDGSFLWKYNPKEAELKENLLHISALKSAFSGKPLDDDTYENHEKILQNTKVSLNISMFLKEPEGIPFKSEAHFVVNMKKQPVPDIEGAKRQFKLEIQTGESTRDFESKRDRRVAMPKNTLPFAELYNK